MSTPDQSHLSTQFAGLLRRVNDSFDIEYGDDPRMAKVGGVYLPVSRGQLETYKDDPGEHRLSLFVPGENRSNRFDFNPNTGVSSVRTYDESLERTPSFGFYDKPATVDEIASHAASTDGRIWDHDLTFMKMDKYETDSGRYVIGLPGTGKLRFDPRSGQVVGPVPHVDGLFGSGDDD